MSKRLASSAIIESVFFNFSKPIAQTRNLRNLLPCPSTWRNPPPASVATADGRIRHLTLSACTNQRVTYRKFGASGREAIDKQNQRSRQDPPAADPIPFGSASPKPNYPLWQVIPQQQQRIFQPAKSYNRFDGGDGGGRRSNLNGRGGAPMLILAVVVGGTVTYYVFHLEQVAQTGRWRFIDVSREQERQMGQATFQQTLSEYRGRILPAHHPISKQVRDVASRIVRVLEEDESSGGAAHGLVVSGSGVGGGGGGGVVSYGAERDGRDPSEIFHPKSTTMMGAGRYRGEPNKTEWEVFVIDDPKQKNAFVLPGGKIFVFTGILPICYNQDGLATVLGHEIAHQLARHSAEKVSGYKVLLFASQILDLLGFDIGLSRLGLTLLLSLPNSRKTESEADYIGLQLMSRACFDPREASKLWERMERSEGGGGGGGGVADGIKNILSTHPVNSSRIKKMEEWLPEAASTRSSSGCPSPTEVGDFRGAAGSLGIRARPSFFN
ncbi:hypothetical protein IE53DRAFT_339821 [Violaceomyces palustris]|uniref:Uncharacterized protein n=1 Tax=Violaceomyces palustris TaxID=1673888 RepID=A0ACD0P491_9BASI|nr:hypothetical protein IE53DRAFT_339821 [Violaceomyces palustris]